MLCASKEKGTDLSAEYQGRLTPTGTLSPTRTLSENSNPEVLKNEQQEMMGVKRMMM